MEKKKQQEKKQKQNVNDKRELDGCDLYFFCFVFVLKGLPAATPGHE